jgi:hypothetical protein
MRKLSRVYFTREEKFYIREAVSKARDMKAAFAFIRYQLERGAYVFYAVKMLNNLNEQAAI